MILNNKSANYNGINIQYRETVTNCQAFLEH